MDARAIVSWFKNVSNDEKRDLIGQLVNECSATLQGEIQELVENLRKRDFISNLPQEICHIVFSHLDIGDLKNVQLVSKRWRDAAVCRMSFWQLACERLGVDASEYGSKAEATEICRFIMAKNRTSPKSWFSLQRYPAFGNEGVKFADYGIDGEERYVVAISDTFGLYGSHVAVINLPSTGATSQQTFVTANFASALKFCSKRAIFIGTFVGIIEHWSTENAPVPVRNFRQHAGAVKSIDADEERDLLFTGGADRSLICWRLSTGEILAAYNKFVNWLVEVKLKPSSDQSSSMIVAVLSIPHNPDLFSTADHPYLADRELLNLTILSFSEETRRFAKLYEVERNYQTGIFRSLTSTASGFRFNRVQQDREIRVVVCEYVLDSGELKCETVSIGLEDQQICGLIGIGKKFCLAHLKNSGSKQLAVLEKRGNTWKLYKLTDPILAFGGGFAWSMTDAIQLSTPKMMVTQFAPGDGTWLDGFRPNSTTGLVFVGITADGSTCFGYWK